MIVMILHLTYVISPDETFNDNFGDFKNKCGPRKITATYV